MCPFISPADYPTDHDHGSQLLLFGKFVVESAHGFNLHAVIFYRGRQFPAIFPGLMWEILRRSVPGQKQMFLPVQQIWSFYRMSLRVDKKKPTGSVPVHFALKGWAYLGWTEKSSFLPSLHFLPSNPLAAGPWTARSPLPQVQCNTGLLRMEYFAKGAVCACVRACLAPVLQFTLMAHGRSEWELWTSR